MFKKPSFFLYLFFYSSTLSYGCCCIHQPMMLLPMLMLSMTVHVKADGVVNKADKLWCFAVLFSTINVALMLSSYICIMSCCIPRTSSVHSYFNVLFSFGVNTTATACVCCAVQQKTHTQLSGHLQLWIFISFVQQE